MTARSIYVLKER